jgi:hypothetical protein
MVSFRSFDIASTPLLLRRGVFVFVGICLISAPTLFAQERRYIVGTSIDFVGGGANSLSNSSVSVGQHMVFFYALYPSIRIDSTGGRSLLNAAYSFGLNRTETGENLHSSTHSASLRFSTPLSQKWTIGLSDAFDQTDDAATFNGIRGVTPASEDFRFAFNPVASHVVSRSNSSSASAAYSLNDKSSLVFSGSHALRRYEGLGQGGLSNQQYMSGSASYNRRTSKSETWSFGYSAAYSDFSSFENSFTHTGFVGYSAELGRDLLFHIELGGAQVHNLQSRDTYAGLNTSAALRKRLRDDSFSLYYSQSAGGSSGLGSTSDTRTAGFSMSRKGRAASLFIDISAFDSRGRFDNQYGAKAVQGSASIGIPLTPRWSFQVGAQYQYYDKSSPYSLDQKRAFLSLRYNNPTLFRFAK